MHTQLGMAYLPSAVPFRSPEGLCLSHRLQVAQSSVSVGMVPWELGTACAYGQGEGGGWVLWGAVWPLPRRPDPEPGGWSPGPAKPWGPRLGPWKGGPCLSLTQDHQRPWERGAGTTGVPRGLLEVGVAEREPSCSSGLTNFGTAMKSQRCACLLGLPPASGKLARRVGESGGGGAVRRRKK